MNVVGTVTIATGAQLDVVINGLGSNVDLSEAFWTQPRSWTFLTGTNVQGTLALGSVGADSGGRSIRSYGTLALQQDATSATLNFTSYTPVEVWRLAHFGTLDNAGDAVDDQDPDKDLVNNLLERAFGGNPNLADHEMLPKIDDSAPMLSIIYRKAKAATDLAFTVEEDDDLTPPWTPATGASEVMSDDGTVEQIRFTRPIGSDDPLFLRVGVTQP